MDKKDNFIVIFVDVSRKSEVIEIIKKYRIVNECPSLCDGQ